MLVKAREEATEHDRHRRFAALPDASRREVFRAPGGAHRAHQRDRRAARHPAGRPERAAIRRHGLPMKRYLGKEVAAAVFYSAGALVPWRMAHPRGCPKGRRRGASAFVQIRTALTYGVLDSLDLAVDAEGALWQSIETALVGELRATRSTPSATRADRGGREGRRRCPAPHRRGRHPRDGHPSGRHDHGRGRLMLR